MNTTQIAVISMSGFALIFSAFNVLGGVIYDFNQARAKNRLAALPRSKQPKARPLVSIIIPTQNSEATIETCLKSITKNYWRKYEIIVVDLASSDETRNIVKAFKKTHPKQPIRLIAKRKSAPAWAGVAAAHKAYAKGQLIMSLSPKAELNRSTIKLAALSFSLDKTVSMLSFNERVNANQTLAGLVQEIEKPVIGQWQKLLSVSKVKYINNAQSYVYRRDIFKQMIKYAAVEDESIARRIVATNPKNRQSHAIYTADNLVTYPAAASLPMLFREKYQRKANGLRYLLKYQSFFAETQDSSKLALRLSLLFVILKQLALLAVPVAFTYCLYLAASFQTPLLFAFSATAMSLFLFLTIWGDDALDMFKKARLSLLIPISYGLFYILSFAQFAALFELIGRLLRAMIPKRISLVSYAPNHKTKQATS